MFSVVYSLPLLSYFVIAILCATLLTMGGIVIRNSTRVGSRGTRIMVGIIMMIPLPICCVGFGVVNMLPYKPHQIGEPVKDNRIDELDDIINSLNEIESFIEGQDNYDRELASIIDSLSKIESFVEDQKKTIRHERGALVAGVSSFATGLFIEMLIALIFAPLLLRFLKGAFQWLVS